MSRGGGRGGRGRGGRGGGGRGGGRMVSSRDVPWAIEEGITDFDAKPSELFPPYKVPQAAPLSDAEERSVTDFLLFREQLHDGPLYTQARTWNHEPTRAYGQDQLNERYGQTNKATVDPFLAVPTYSQRFVRPERALPDLASMPFNKEFFPAELHATLDGDDNPATAAAGKKRKLAGSHQGGAAKKVLALSSITSLRTAEDVFLSSNPDDAVQYLGRKGYDRALDIVNKLEKGGGGGEGGEGGAGDDALDLVVDDDEWVRRQNEDDDAEADEVEDDPDQYEDEQDENDDYNGQGYWEREEYEDEYDDGGDDGAANDY